MQEEISWSLMCFVCILSKVGEMIPGSGILDGEVEGKGTRGRGRRQNRISGLGPDLAGLGSKPTTAESRIGCEIAEARKVGRLNCTRQKRMMRAYLVLFGGGVEVSWIDFWLVGKRREIGS